MAEETQTPAPEAPPAVSPIKTELDKIRSSQSGAVLDVEEQPSRGMFWIAVRPQSLLAVARLLRDDPALDYKMLTDVTCVDRPETERRFNVTYNFYSVSRNRRLFLR